MKSPSKTQIRTRKNLIEAFMTVYRTKTIDRVSVRDITDAAGYHRSTFYLYFKDVYDLADAAEDQVLTELNAEIQKILSEDLNVLREEKGLERADQTLSALLAEVRSFATADTPFSLSLRVLRLENDLVTALALARSARLRTETCGCHVRTDSRPEESGKFRTVVSAGADGEISAARLPIEA